MKRAGLVVACDAALFFLSVVLLCSCVSKAAFYQKHEEARAFKMERDQLLAEKAANEKAAKESPSSQPQQVVPPPTSEKIDAVLDETTAGCAELDEGVAPPVIKKKAQSHKVAQDANYSALRRALNADTRAGHLYFYEKGGMLAITIPGGLLFSPGEARIKKLGQRVVVSIAASIKKLKGKNFRVIGHSDATPQSEATKAEYVDNARLSLLRAEKVADILVRNGVSRSSITSVMRYGDSKPIRDDSTSSGRAFNRRVVIVIDSGK